MDRAKCGLAVVLAFVLQRTLLVHVVIAGTVPQLLPALIALLGMARGREMGAGCGLFAGALGVLGGYSPWFLVLYSLLGGISGAVFHNSAGFWGKCLLAVPLLGGMEGLLLLGHWLAGEGLALSTALGELGLTLACLPAAALILKVLAPGKASHL